MPDLGGPRGSALVILGNPPYRDVAKGTAPWIEARRAKRGGDVSTRPSLDEFRRPGLGRREFHLHNTCIYFWRWAVWKAMEAYPDVVGVVALVSSAAWLYNDTFAGMRGHLRRVSDVGWVVDLSPEGMQPKVSTRIFPGVQIPLSAAVFVGWGQVDHSEPAKIWRSTLEGTRDEKLARLEALLARLVRPGPRAEDQQPAADPELTAAAAGGGRGGA